MNLKHKVIKDFQYITTDKKIFTLKAGTIIDEYVFKLKNEEIDIDKDIIANNPDFFEVVNWQAELLSYIKSNKLPQPAILTKKLTPFISDLIMSFDKPQKGGSVDTDREMRLKQKEEDFSLRTSRLERKEQEVQEDLASLKLREDSYRVDLQKLSKKELSLQESLREIDQKQRNYDMQILEAINDNSIDEKYKHMEENITQQYKDITQREKHVDELLSNIEEYNVYLDQKLAEIFDWKEALLRNWNYDLYPVPPFPFIEKRFLK